MRILVLAVAVLALAPAASAATPCKRPDGARVTKANSTVVIYSRGNHAAGTFWACYRRTGRRAVIYRQGVDEVWGKQAASFRVAGPYVAFIAVESIKSLGNRYVVLFNARSGKHVQKILVPDSTEPFAFGLDYFAVNANGVVAWLVTRFFRLGPTPRNTSLYVRDRGGITQLMDEGPIGSLRNAKLTLSTISWTHDGVARSAPLAIE